MVDHRISTGLICYAHLFFVIKQLATKHYGVQRKWKKKKEKESKKSKPAHLLLTLSGCCLEL